MPDNPSVEACVLRSFCDATFASNERRGDAIAYYARRVHITAAHGGGLEGCEQCMSEARLAGLVPC